jgi:hypothetical protein
MGDNRTVTRWCVVYKDAKIVKLKLIEQDGKLYYPDGHPNHKVAQIGRGYFKTPKLAKDSLDYYWNDEINKALDRVDYCKRVFKKIQDTY